tara:strand:+ start:1610 stop:3424 length:1815 start_codon:yes stop_codon:yes gene_type:complete
MARKSAWQQFADNFDSTYNTFNTMFSDIEEGRIMSEEPEELQSGIGPGPKSQYQASYGGQIYNEPITPEKLRGLRNQRLIDNMNKWGDTEGAMKLQLDQATLRNQNAAADLAEGQLQDRIANAGLQNKALLASIGLTEAQIEEYKTLLPHKQTEYLLNAIAKRSDNRVKLATEGDDISKSASDASTAESAATVAALEAKNFEETNYLRVKDEKTGFIAAINENEAREIGAKVALSENNQKLAVNDMMTNFRTLAKDGEFADDQAAQDWMVDQMFNINPTLALDMRDNYNSHELAVITHSSTMFKTKAMEAYQQGGVEGLSTAIDNLNGVDDTEIEYNDKNDDVTIWAVDPKTKKRLRKIVSGTPGGTFDMNLQQMLDPAAAMEISKAYHDDLTSQVNVLLKEAEVEYTKEMAAKAKAEGIAAGNTTKEFDKNDFLIRMLVEDPENELAWQGLVGMDLTAEEVKEMVRQEKMREGEKPKVDTGTTTDDTKDGVVYKGSGDGETSEKTSKTDTSKSYASTLKEAQANVAAYTAGSENRKEAEAELAKLTTVDGLAALIEQLTTEISESLDKPRSTTPANTKLRNQKTKYRDELIAELEKLSKGLGG